jgi:hypothetical protein
MSELEVFEWREKDANKSYTRYVFFKDKKNFLSIDFHGDIVEESIKNLFR